MQPETRYARLGEDRLAYQVLGEGPDLVLTMGAFGHVDLKWEDPGVALFLRRLASFSRLIFFDRRGTGASDPLPEKMPPPWEAYADEVAAVMDAVGSRRAALMATTAEAGPMALFFAATRPERTSALVLGNASARYVADDDYPIGFEPERAEAMISGVEETLGDRRPGWTRASPAGPATSGSAAGWPRCSAPSPAPGRSTSSCGPCSRWTSGRCCRWSRRRRWCCTAGTSRCSRSSTAATWPSTSPTPGWSCCPAPTAP